MSGSPSRAPRRRRLRCAAGTLVQGAAGAGPDLIRRLCILVPALAYVLAGCVQSGDFGRPKQSVWNDLILPVTGSLAAHARGEPVSPYIYTDDEEELHDRAWRFLMPAHERSWFDGVVTNLVRTRILPAALHPSDITSYHRALMGGDFRSAASRYRRLGEDAAGDTKLIGPFAGTALRVMAADRVRLRSLAYVRDLDDAQVHYAVTRVAENRCLIAWVRHESQARLESYRYALERLLVEAPQNEAVAAERELARLGAQRQALDGIIVSLPNFGCAGSDAELQIEAGTSPDPTSFGKQIPIVAKD